MSWLARYDYTAGICSADQEEKAATDVPGGGRAAAFDGGGGGCGSGLSAALLSNSNARFFGRHRMVTRVTDYSHDYIQTAFRLHRVGHQRVGRLGDCQPHACRSTVRTTCGLRSDFIQTTFRL